MTAISLARSISATSTQLFGAQEARALLRQRIIDRVDVAAEKTQPRLARLLLNELRRRVLARVAARLLRQPSEKTRRLRPIVGEFRAIDGKLDGLARFRLQPGLDVAGSQARRREALGWINRARSDHGDRP